MTINGFSHNSYVCTPGPCIGTSGGLFQQRWFCPSSCGTFTGTACSSSGSAGWDSVTFTVPMPHAAPSPTFRHPATGVLYRYMMFHMGQKTQPPPPPAPDCGGSGLFGSIGIDFSNDGLAWTAYAGNPVLTDTTWSQTLGFAAGSSIEKGEVVYYNGTYYLMGIVATILPGALNS